MSARAKQSWAAVTDIGRVRTHNEDAVLAQPPLFVVADGLGGHEAGEVASSIAVETVRDHAPRRAEGPALARAVKAANRAVIRAAKEGVGRTGMGTTITAAMVDAGHIVIAQVGDSRAYLMHNGTLERLTEDHSMMADLIKRGQITEAESRVHPNRSVITRALGTDTNMSADSYEYDAETGDRLLLCSDGLTSMLEDPQIAEILGGYRDPTLTAHALIAAAVEAGGHDNVSVIVVDIEADPVGVASTRRRGWLSILGWLLAFALIVGGIAYGTYRYAQSRAYLIAENGVIVVYRGVPGEIAGLELSWRVASTDIPVASLDPGTQQRLAGGEQVDGVETALGKAEAYRALVTPSLESSPTP